MSSFYQNNKTYRLIQSWCEALNKQNGKERMYRELRQILKSKNYFIPGPIYQIKDRYFAENKKERVCFKSKLSLSHFLQVPVYKVNELLDTGAVFNGYIIDELMETV